MTQASTTEPKLDTRSSHVLPALQERRDTVEPAKKSAIFVFCGSDPSNESSLWVKKHCAKAHTEWCDPECKVWPSRRWPLLMAL